MYGNDNVRMRNVWHRIPTKSVRECTHTSMPLATGRCRPATLPGFFGIVARVVPEHRDTTSPTSNQAVSIPLARVAGSLLTE